MPGLFSAMFSMFLDGCKIFIDYIRKLWISGGGTHRKNGGSIKCTHQYIFYIPFYSGNEFYYRSQTVIKNIGIS